MSAAARRTPLVQRLALSLGVLVVLALAVEGAVRLRNWVKYGTVGPAHAFELDPGSGLMIPVPGRDTGRIRVDSRGFRNPELELPKPEGRVRVAFLGASTTFCAEVTSNEHTWPHLVWERLARTFPDADSDYVNAGVGGYPIEKTRVNLRARVAPLEPDLIVIYHAVNDVSVDTREEARARGVYAGHADGDSWLARYSLAWYLLEKNWTLRQRQRAAAAGRDRLEVDADALAQGFRRRLAALVAEAREVAPVVAVATFSHRVRADQTPQEQLAACNTALYYMPYMTPAGVLAAFDAYNRAIRAVAAETGCLLIDGEDEVPGDGLHFADSVHLTDRGCLAMAERVAARLLASPAVRGLFERAEGH